MNKLYLPINEFAQFVSNIKPVEKQYDNVFRTVNNVMNKRVGNCADIALLVNEYCKLHKYSRKVINLGIAYFNSDNDMTIINHQSHVICAFQYENKWTIIQQCDDMQPLFIGNYSLENTIKQFARIYIPLLQGYLLHEKPNIKVVRYYYHILTDNLLDELEQLSSNKYLNKQKILSNCWHKVPEHTLILSR